VYAFGRVKKIYLFLVELKHLRRPVLAHDVVVNLISLAAALKTNCLLTIYHENSEDFQGRKPNLKLFKNFLKERFFH
jgi:hypothetical protein